MAPTAIRADRQQYERKILKFECEIKAYVQDIAENTQTLSDLNQLNLDVKRVIRELQHSLSDYQNFGNEQDDESEKQSILLQVNKCRKQLEMSQQSLRKANLSCQLGLDKLARDRLFDNSHTLTSDDGNARHRRNLSRENAAKQSADITANLQRVSQMMAAQVKQGEDTMGKLVDSSGTLSETHEEMKSQWGLIHISQRLIKKYGRRELTDRILIALALTFFMACVLYVVKKRLLPAAAL